MARINPLIPLVDIQQQEPTGDRLITFGTITGGTPYAGTTYANLFALECLLQDLDGSAVYQMSGTVASPSWTVIGTGAAGATGPTGYTGPIGPTGYTGPAASGTFSTDGATGPVATITVVDGIVTNVTV